MFIGALSAIGAGAKKSNNNTPQAMCTEHLLQLEGIVNGIRERNNPEAQPIPGHLIVVELHPAGDEIEGIMYHTTNAIQAMQEAYAEGVAAIENDPDAAENPLDARAALLLRAALNLNTLLQHLEPFLHLPEIRNIFYEAFAMNPLERDQVEIGGRNGYFQIPNCFERYGYIQQREKEVTTYTIIGRAVSGLLAALTSINAYNTLQTSPDILVSMPNYIAPAAIAGICSAAWHYMPSLASALSDNDRHHPYGRVTPGYNLESVRYGLLGLGFWRMTHPDRQIENPLLRTIPMGIGAIETLVRALDEAFPQVNEPIIIDQINRQDAYRLLAALGLEEYEIGCKVRYVD
jgi:hypothetical protein